MFSLKKKGMQKIGILCLKTDIEAERRKQFWKPGYHLKDLIIALIFESFSDVIEEPNEEKKWLKKFLRKKRSDFQGLS